MLTDTDGTVKIGDYGYSILLHLLIEKLLPDHCGKRCFWIAPENLKGSSALDTRSDIWGVGCLAVELLTSKPPFWEETGGSVEELLKIEAKSRSFS